MPSPPSRPTYRLHKPSGNAYVRIDGKQVYLGRFDSPDSRARFAELLEEWSTRNERAPVTLTIDDLVLRYVRHVDRHYRKPNGEPTTEPHCIRLALRPLVRLFGSCRVRDFGPLKLAEVRDAMIAAKLVRTSINSNIGRIRRLFKWGVSQEPVPPQVLAALQALAGLQAGRSDAVESEPVAPVSWVAVEAVKPFLSRPLWGVVRLQWITGMRPGEALAMRGCDLVTTGRIWEYRPADHKTRHRGKERPIFLGPQAQDVVTEFLKPDLTAYLFSPRDGRAEYVGTAYRDGAKVAKVGARMPRERYDVSTYGRAVRNACLRAGIEPWHPHQLRHSAATRIRREAGIETARVVLGHSSVAMTELYAEADRARAAEIMGRIG